MKSNKQKKIQQKTNIYGSCIYQFKKKKQNESVQTLFNHSTQKSINKGIQKKMDWKKMKLQVMASELW